MQKRLWQAFEQSIVNKDPITKMKSCKTQHSKLAQVFLYKITTARKLFSMTKSKQTSRFYYYYMYIIANVHTYNQLLHSPLLMKPAFS